MLTLECLQAYVGPALLRDASQVILAPHALLSPYISHYHISQPADMPPTQIIVPSVSNTLVYAIAGNAAYGGLRGVNTRPVDIAGYARRFDLLVLIEFHPAGLYPFLGFGQDALLDASFGFMEVDRTLDAQILHALESVGDVAALHAQLDAIWLARLDTATPHTAFLCAMARLAASGGQVGSRELAQSVFYSEKQLGRLFRQHLGTGIKTYGRILRMRRALFRIERGGARLAKVAQETGYYDEAHLLHDLSDLCGITPQDYLLRMSDFYNDPFKPG